MPDIQCQLCYETTASWKYCGCRYICTFYVKASEACDKSSWEEIAWYSPDWVTKNRWIFYPKDQEEHAYSPLQPSKRHELVSCKNRNQNSNIVFYGCHQNYLHEFNHVSSSNIWKVKSHKKEIHTNGKWLKSTFLPFHHKILVYG